MPDASDREFTAWYRGHLDALDDVADEVHVLDCDATPRNESTYRRPGPCNCGEPERARADTAAKRKVIDAYEHATEVLVGGPAGILGDVVAKTLLKTLKTLAEANADDADYRQEWRP